MPRFRPALLNCSRPALLNLPSVPCFLVAQEAVDIFGNVDELLQIYQEARATRQTDTMAGVEEALHLGEGVGGREVRR